MTKLTKVELVEMKAIGYMEGNAATIPDVLKVGQELRDKIEAHEAELAQKDDPAPAEAEAAVAPMKKPVAKKTVKALRKHG